MEVTFEDTLLLGGRGGRTGTQAEDTFEDTFVESALFFGDHPVTQHSESSLKLRLRLPFKIGLSLWDLLFCVHL
jgi:hypothetical protein